MENSLGKVGLIGRFKPLHNGGAVMLETVCEKAKEVIIGIGSCNKYNLRNPFTSNESETMLRLFLSPRFSNFRFLYIPDFAQILECRDGRKWREYVTEKFGELDCFVSANDFVSRLLKDTYRIISPADIIPIDKQVRLKATQVRIEIASYGNWKSLVPEEVSDYLEKNGIVERFQKEFGLQTLALLSGNIELKKSENAAEEELHAREI